MKRRLGLLLNHPYLWGIFFAIVLIVFAFIKLLEPYETIGFLNLPLHASGGGVEHVVDQGEQIPAVEMSVIQEALHDQGFHSSTASVLSTQLYQELLTPVATATPAGSWIGSPTSFAETTTPAGISTATAAGISTRTPSASPSPTRTATPVVIIVVQTATDENLPASTLTKTPNFTATATMTATATATATPTSSSTATATATQTSTTTATAFFTQPVSATASSTRTPTATVTITPPPVATATVSPAVTVTATVSATATTVVPGSATPTITATLTLTPTQAVTPLSTITPTATLTPIATPTLTVTPTWTIVPIATNTPTHTPTHTPTLTGTVTPTVTFTPSATAIFTPTPTDTLVPSATPAVESCILPGSIAGILPSDDTYIYRVKAQENYGGEHWIAIRPEFNGEMRGLIRFDLSAIPSGATITSATLYLNSVESSNSQVTNLYRVTAPWSEMTATWNFPWNAAGGDFDSRSMVGRFDNQIAGCAIAIDLSSLVTAWVDGTYENNGILISATGPRFAVHYISKDEPITLEMRPQLVVSVAP